MVLSIAISVVGVASMTPLEAAYSISAGSVSSACAKIASAGMNITTNSGAGENWRQ